MARQRLFGDNQKMAIISLSARIDGGCSSI